MKVDAVLIGRDETIHITKSIDIELIMDAHLLEWRDRIYRFDYKIYGQPAYRFVECEKPVKLED